MTGASSTSNPPIPRKRDEAETSSLKRARDESAFTRCLWCNEDVSVTLIDMHCCCLEAMFIGKKTRTKPKRPLSAFFIFMEEFRKIYKEAHPNSKRGISEAREGGEKWRSLTDEEKKVYTVKAAELMEEYREARKKYHVESYYGESDDGCAIM